MNVRQPISANSYLSAFRRVSGILPGHNLGWLRLAREAAIERFANSGFPTQRDEDWKYTSVAAIENARFNLLPEPQYDLLASQVAAQALPDAHLLVFVNGFLEPGLSRLGRLPPGTILGSLGYMLEEHPGRLEEVLVVDNADSAFSDLNLAFMTDGAYVLLPPEAAIKAPVQLFFIASETNLAIQPRNLVLAAAGSSATIVEHHMAARENSYFTNAVTDIVLGPGASIEHH
ncbi:MAG: Fe-S cluster assembly protein SufD, partial [Zoogloea sp.]|nr:Fe-S cluster assembly protein SufD [Zoogloea sp.]